ncbi:MAG TPA: hypothetical protein VF800_02915 [Telluria sp.]|jgi:hypothetical protein
MTTPIQDAIDDLTTIKDYPGDAGEELAIRSMKFLAKRALTALATIPVTSVAADEPGGALADALNRCCAELPEGYVITIGVERDSGWVAFSDPNGADFDIAGEGHLSDDVIEAFDACVADALAIAGHIEGVSK